VVFSFNEEHRTAGALATVNKGKEKSAEQVLAGPSKGKGSTCLFGE
jgi:hypothetical protein